MYSVELYSRVRRACHVDGMSAREAARQFGLDRKTVTKILMHPVPPGYRRKGPPVRPKLDPFVGIIDQIPVEDKSVQKKQRHTAKRIFERLRDEHGFTGEPTIVSAYARKKRRRSQEACCWSFKILDSRSAWRRRSGSDGDSLYRSQVSDSTNLALHNLSVILLMTTKAILR